MYSAAYCPKNVCPYSLVGYPNSQNVFEWAMCDLMCVQARERGSGAAAG